MKFRIAKKIMWGRSSYKKRCRELRPMYFDVKKNTYCLPSWHNIDKISRARTVYMKHIKKNKK